MQLYDPEAKQFLADRLIGTCPKCGATDSYGDQCENCEPRIMPPILLIQEVLSQEINQSCDPQTLVSAVG